MLDGSIYWEDIIQVIRPTNISQTQSKFPGEWLMVEQSFSLLFLQGAECGGGNGTFSEKCDVHQLDAQRAVCVALTSAHRPCCCRVKERSVCVSDLAEKLGLTHFKKTF